MLPFFRTALITPERLRPLDSLELPEGVHADANGLHLRIARRVLLQNDELCVAGCVARVDDALDVELTRADFDDLEPVADDLVEHIVIDDAILHALELIDLAVKVLRQILLMDGEQATGVFIDVL